MVLDTTSGVPTRNRESFNTFILSKIDTSLRPWTKKETFLPPHNLDHTSQNNLAVITEIMTELGISPNSLISATQNTTDNSINTFNQVSHVRQLLCCSHANELVSMHSVEDDVSLNDVFIAIRKVMVRAKGNKSSKRRKLLSDKCTQAGILFRSIYLPCATRWG